jgi:hypothetical protein
VGPQLIQFYNDAYTPVLGLRHPSGLGQPAAQCWSEAWPTVGPLADAVMIEGVSTWNEQLQIVMTRNGWPEEVYMTFSYSPITDETGGIGGLFCACTEETQRVLSERRLRTLRALAEEAGQAGTVEQACKTAVTVLDRNGHDLPFTLVYLLDSDGSRAKLMAAQGDDSTLSADLALIEIASGKGAWPLHTVSRDGSAVDFELVNVGLNPVPSRIWPERVTRAVALPMTRPGQDRLAGFVIAGISLIVSIRRGPLRCADLAPFCE